jgi:hypothetical protein
MAADLKTGPVMVVANRVRSPADLERIRAETGMEPVGVLPESVDLTDYHGAAPQGAVREAVDNLRDRIESI